MPFTHERHDKVLELYKLVRTEARVAPLSKTNTIIKGRTTDADIEDWITIKANTGTALIQQP